MLSYILYTALAATRLHSAFYAIIPDCDEVFNYWEPLNFLTRFFGKQTWEYSPEFAIRSYAYLLQYSIFIYPINWVKYVGVYYNIQVPSYTLFYFIRVLLALAFTAAEIKLSRSLKFFNPKIQNWFLLAQIVSPGMYQASISILPSAYTLLFNILIASYTITFFNANKLIKSIDDELVILEKSAEDLSNDNEEDESKVDKLVPRTNTFLNLYRVSSPLISKYYTMVLLLTAIGGLSGWPFSMVLVLPFLIYSFTSTYTPKSVLKNDFSKSRVILIYVLSGFSCLFFIGFFISQFDGLFYKKFVSVPFNIVFYNVFSKSGGPSLFGTEPWDYYIKNLLLNYHLLFVIATINLFTIPTTYQLVLYKLPLLLWFVIFFSQPHKEERFMYPVYHLISISFAQFMSCATFRSNFVFKLFKKFLNLFVILGTFLLFVSRVNNTNSNYSAPVKIFKYLSDTTSFNQLPETVCLGREWYHYPSSFFLNANQRLKFTKSSFEGMLPSDFVEPKTNTFEGLVGSTSFVPEGFNDMNRFNEDFVISSATCDYFVDIDKETSVEDETNLSNFNILKCYEFLDQDSLQSFEKSFGFLQAFDKFIRMPWMKLQQDLSVIELNRKFMEMYGIENPDGTQMFDKLYDKLEKIEGYYLNHFNNHRLNKNNMCLSKRK